MVSKNLEMGKLAVEKGIKVLFVNGHRVEYNGVRGLGFDLTNSPYPSGVQSSPFVLKQVGNTCSDRK